MSTDLSRQIIARCGTLDIPLVGFARAEQWDDPPFEPWVPEAFRPSAIYPGVRSVIVMGIPVALPVLETAPSIWYHELYKAVNTLLDTQGYRIATWLNGMGYPSLWVPRDGYGSIAVLKENPVAFFSHRHAAYLAGLGTFGVNNMLLTEQYGPRVRFVSVFTTAELPAGTPPGTDLCTRCMECVRACPVGAIGEAGYPGELTDKQACAARSEALLRRHISPCGLCIRACPVGRDRRHFSREETGIYDEEDARHAGLHAAWKHVRSYGSHRQA